MNDPFKVRPRRGFVLLVVDFRKSETASGLIIPVETNYEKLHEGSGVIVRVNPVDAKRLAAIGVKQGDRVMYRSYLKHANRLEVNDGNKFWADGQEKYWSFISIDDLVMWLDYGTEVGLLSERKDQ